MPILPSEMIFRTENSMYEVRPDQRRFRRLERDATGTIVPISAWQQYEHVGTVAIGERVRFFLPGTPPTSAAVAWTTTPVRELLAAV
jgi:hypothetical protein